MDKLNPKKIKSCRKMAMLTIQELADKVGVSKQAISYFENGKRNPTFDTLHKIASVCGVKIDFFYRESMELTDIHILLNQ